MLFAFAATNVTTSQNIGNPYQAGLVADSPIDCIDYTEVPNVNSATDVTAGAENCVLQENYSKGPTVAGFNLTQAWDHAIVFVNDTGSLSGRTRSTQSRVLIDLTFSMFFMPNRHS